MSEDLTSTEDTGRKTIDLTANIVAAFVANNELPASELPGLIGAVHGALKSLASPVPAETAAEKPQPAVPVKKSVHPDYIVCLEDGKKMKMLKRHLMGTYNMTPDEYRQRWGLPADYPMVAPNYAQQRSMLAKAIGLGQRPVAPEPPAPEPVKKTRAKKKAAA